MLNTESIATDCPKLQHYDWPPVAEFKAFSPEMAAFLELDIHAQQAQVENLRENYDQHGSFLNKCLGVIYAYCYSYMDSPVHLRSDTLLEAKLMQAKIVLEEELINYWLPPSDLPEINTQEKLADYLRNFVVSNPGVYHEFWDYLRHDASRDAMEEFLRLALCRNEVVDDECALLVVGLQGNMKKAMTSNLWDECGNGSLDGFHTYWLRRFLEHSEQWESLPQYRRDNQKPWSSSILSNVFNVLLTRPGYKHRAYGFFSTSESWVEPHFVRILDGLRRVGLDHEDIEIYFKAHITIDPQHSDELIDSIMYQTPPLNKTEIKEILHGAHHAVAAALYQYRDVMAHLKSVDNKALAA
jgi:hypothetical protein